MSKILDEALGLREPRPPKGEDDDEFVSINAMVAIEPTDPPDAGDPPHADDLWKDYEHSRTVAKNNLKQAQIVLQSAIEFTNSSPSARSFEVLGQLITKVNECSDKLLDLQKKMGDLKPKEGLPTTLPDGAEVNQYNIFTGDPTSVLKQLDEMRENKEAIDGEVAN